MCQDMTEGNARQKIMWGMAGAREDLAQSMKPEIQSSARLVGQWIPGICLSMPAPPPPAPHNIGVTAMHK